MPEENQAAHLQTFPALFKQKPVFSFLGVLAAVFLIIFYIISFLLPYDTSSKNQLIGLLVAAPTIPILFLFSFLVPNLICYIERKENYFEGVIIALIISVAVFVFAIFGIANLITILFVVPSILAAIIAFVFFKKFLHSLTVGILVAAPTGVFVVASYIRVSDFLFKLLNLKSPGTGGFTSVNTDNPLVLSWDFAFPHPAFGLLDVLLLLMLGLILVFIYKKLGLASLALNAIFVMVTFSFIAFGGG